jgi:hypothetical protein
MPFYLTWLPRFIVGWSAALSAGTICFIFGKHDQNPHVKIHWIRQLICEYAIRLSTYIGEFCSGIVKVHEVKAERLDLFRKYLGPDWTP